MTADDDDELVSMTKAIMHTTHGQTVSDEQARGIIALILAGRDVANPAAYLRHALAQHDGARYAPPGPAPAQHREPTDVDLITMRKAALLRDGESPAEARDRADRSHRGADLCRRMLAERPRPLVERAELPGELHGPALAAEQAAQSRALRDRLPAPPPDDDDHQDHDDDDEPDDEDDQLDHQDQDEDDDDDGDPPPF
jgi:hypothetical protein